MKQPTYHYKYFATDEETTFNDFRAGKLTGNVVSWFTASLENSNACCIYCGVYLRDPDQPESDKEHLIARKFIPSGYMKNHSFNFIFRACKPCNNRKANSERHVSSVTLFNSPSRRQDYRVNCDAVRKAKNDFHPTKKGVLIQDAQKHTSVVTSFGANTIKFGMVAPPQLDLNLVGELALSHIQGLYALIRTLDYKDPLKTILLNQDLFSCYDYYWHDDWGNPRAVEIANRVRDWQCLVNIVSAEGYFKATIRISKQDWFWALEWNQQLRLLGGISSSNMNLFQGLPSEEWKYTPEGGRRQHVPLDIKDDHLFAGVVSD